MGKVERDTGVFYGEIVGRVCMEKEKSHFAV